MSTLIIDDLSSASGGTGPAVDVPSQLGNGAAVQPFATAVAESTVTAGAVAFQWATAAQITGGVPSWQTGTPVNVSGGAAVAVPRPGVAVVLARLIVTTPIVGGKVTGIITA